MIEYRAEVRKMDITVLDSASLGDDTPFELLKEIGNVTVYNTSTPDEAKERIADAEVIIINKVKITDELLSCAKRLKLICEFATGYDNIDVISAKKRGIAVCNVPAYSTSSVTLITVSTALALLSHLKEYDEYVCSGAYTASGVPNKLTPVFHEVSGMTWGIVGYGNIGKSVARVAEAMGANVIAYTRTVKDGVKNVDLETLCKESDVITLHCPLTDKTRGLIDAHAISLMKKSTVLVNEARGAVVDERAVRDAIINDRIGGFGCDVYSTEPMPKNHPYNDIVGRKNVILTPHVAWGAYEARVRCLKIIIENIKSYYSGARLNRVDPE